MELTEEVLRRFVGGQLETQNPQERYLYRGEIKAIRADGEGDNATLTVELEWNAKGEGSPPLPERWVKSDVKRYEISLMICTVSDIGQGRICLHASIIGETSVLYPKGGSALNRSKVEGL